MLGDFSNERLDVSAIGRDFGWWVAQTPDLSGLREISRSNTVIAVLIHAEGLGLSWQEALRNSRAAAPTARLIMCHKVQQAHDRTEMADAGAARSIRGTPIAGVRLGIQDHTGATGSSAPEN